MVFKKRPESHSGPSGARWEFVRLSSTILGLLYLFAGLGVSGVTGIRYYYRVMPPGERIYWFHYGNGTPLFPDTQMLGIFSFLSFATVFLLMATGFLIIIVLGYYRKGHDGYYGRDGDDLFPGRSLSRIQVNNLNLISISAWLACITITGIFVIGFPVSDGIWVFTAVWILAIVQTFYVRNLQQEYSKRK